MKPDILIIIPARGGSKGIPRKNLRSLNGKPLLSYAITAAFKSIYEPDIYVTSEDDEILSLALKFGVKIHKRDAEKALDNTTLDPVIYDAYQYASIKEEKNYDIIVTLQPTSPLVKTESIDKAIERLLDNREIDTVISAKDDTHLTWRKEDGVFLPNYPKRVNRQYLPPTYKETGAFLITRAGCISEQNRIGDNVDLYLLNAGESIDVDKYEDWILCEYYLRRKKILFVVSGYEEIGLGHVYNTLLLANDILNHEISFLVDKKSKLAMNKISEYNYPVFLQKNENILEDIKLFNPHMVINDILDTSSSYMFELRKMGVAIVNFEDLGDGASFADLVINAIYPEQESLPNHYFGPRYFCLRDEFLLSPSKKISTEVNNVLIAFGGVDPNNYTHKVLEAIYDYCIKKKIKINIVAGLGYKKYETLKEFNGSNVVKNSSNISKYMLKADIIFTSAGRTTYEAAAIGTPTIVIAQNGREMTHFFASSEYGFLNLGLGTMLSTEYILMCFRDLVESVETRKQMNAKMQRVDLTQGRSNVKQLICQLLEWEQ